MSIEIYREEGANFRSVRVRVERDEVVVETHDMGPLAERVWGDAEYEFRTSVKREHWGDLAMALIAELLSGDPEATDRVRSICKKHEVPHDWASWP